MNVEPVLRWTRRTVAIVFVLTGVAAANATRFDASWQVCSQQVARVGNVPVVRTCRDPSFTDADVLSWFILAGLLLVPDFTRIAIPGVLELEREVKKQEKRQAEIEADIIRLRVNSVVTQQQQSSQSVAVNVLPSSTDLSVLLSEMDVKERAFAERTRNVTPGDDPTAGSEP